MHIIVHVLRFVGPGAVNRDRQGFLKSIMMGTERLRFSSQKEKFSFREYFKRLIGLPISTQTRSLAAMTETELKNLGVKDDKARELAIALLDNFLSHNLKKKEAKKVAKKAAEDKVAAAKKAENPDKKEEAPEKEEESTDTETVRIFPEEKEELLQACKDLASGKVKDASLIEFTHAGIAIDIAMSGRMRPTRIPGAVTVGEAISINSLVSEEDFFTASDDLRNESFYEKDEAAFAMGGRRFLATAVMYEHVMINCERLLEDLGDKKPLSQRVMEEILEACHKAGPSSNSTNGAGTKTLASYIMVEKLAGEPRSLVPAFEIPVQTLAEGVQRIQKLKAAYDKETPSPFEEYFLYFDETGELRSKGSLQNLRNFI